jgi:hypothetical protein
MPNPEQFDVKPVNQNAAQEGNPLSLLDLQERNPYTSGRLSTGESDPLDAFDVVGSQSIRGIAAASTLFASGLSGFHTELASMKDLARLRELNPRTWGDTLTWNEKSLGSVRYELQQHRATAGAYRLQGEQHVLDGIKTRGAIKGVAVGAAALVGTMAVDALVFGDTPRTAESQLVDAIGLPAIGFAPMNPYLKGAAMVGLHTAARLYDKYFVDDSKR